MLRERLARGTLTLKRWRASRPGYGFLSRQLILARSRFQLFQLKLHLLQKPRLALGTVAVKRAAQLLDLKLEMGDQRVRAGCRRTGASRNGFGFHAGSALGEDHRMSGGKIGGKSVKRRCHSARES